MTQPIHHLTHQAGPLQGNNVRTGHIIDQLGNAERCAQGQLVEDGAGIVGERCETSAE